MNHLTDVKYYGLKTDGLKYILKFKRTDKNFCMIYSSHYSAMSDKNLIFVLNYVFLESNTLYLCIGKPSFVISECIHPL